MKKILVVLTGGTIGSRIEGKLIDVSGEAACRLISLYYEKYGGGEQFEVIQPMNLLSENMTPGKWSRLCESLSCIPYENYRGVILTHGSDTLAYSSALLGMLFHHVPVPLVLVASNYALTEKGSNGLSNFKNAVDFINLALLRGVFTIYSNAAGENNVYLATRLMEAEGYGDQFSAFGGKPFGRMEEGRLILNREAYQPSVEEINENTGRLTEKKINFSKKIWLLRPYPGLDYESLRLTQKPAAILHYLYHSATACTEEENYSFLLFLESCRKKNIKVYTATYKKAEGERYATADAVLKAGAIPMLNISPEAAYTKLMILYNIGNKGDKEQINRNIYFESLCLEA